MKSKKFTFTDFEIDTISNQELKTIKGGLDTTPPPTEEVDPRKNPGGGNN